MLRQSFDCAAHLTFLRRWSILLCVALISPSGALLGATRAVPEQYSRIQEAIDASTDGDTVLISPGIFTGAGNRAIEFRGRDIVVTSRAGAAATIIDCQQAARGFYLHEGESPAARIEGLTVRNGRATFNGLPASSEGGGIMCAVSHATIADCVLIDNHADSNGGGIYLGSNGIVLRCTIAGNVADMDGGGIAQSLGTATIEDCVITGNTADEGGGVAFIGTAANTLRGCTISANSSIRGGGVRGWNRIFLERCLVWDNCAPTEIYAAGPGAEFRCSAIDTTKVFSMGPVYYDPYCVFEDPHHCGGGPCGPSTQGNFGLHPDSPCLPENSPCGQLIGALGQGCGGPPPLGACCLNDGACLLRTSGECAAESGTYLGDFTECEPDPCAVIPIDRTTWGQIKARFR